MLLEITMSLTGYIVNLSIELIANCVAIGGARWLYFKQINYARATEESNERGIDISKLKYFLFQVAGAVILIDEIVKSLNKTRKGISEQSAQFKSVNIPPHQFIVDMVKRTHKEDFILAYTHGLRTENMNVLILFRLFGGVLRNIKIVSSATIGMANSFIEFDKRKSELLKKGTIVLQNSTIKR